MKILDNTKSLSTLVADTSNGLGQIQPLSCVVTEELNGIYELDFTVNVNDRHYADLKNSGLVKVTVGDGSEQIFRIYKIDEPINMISSVHCQHITYDLSKVVVKPFTATGAVNIKNQLVRNMLGRYPFSTWTDITNRTSTFTNDIPRYFRECLGGYEGSVLDVLRPEYEWDNLTVKLHARRGSDNGVRISYGKNLIDYSQEQNNENVYDGVYGYAVVDEVTYKADSYYNKTGATYPRILNVDFSSDYESGQVPTSAELLQKATTYAQNNSIEVPSINIKIDFIPLWQTEEYKNILPLERVSLGDTVHVYFDKLNVEASSRVIKTQWNVLTNKYDSIELGDAKANLNTIITDSISTAVDEAVSNMDIDVGYIEDDLNDMAKLIINGLGLYFTREALPSGGYRFYLHNEPQLADSDVRYYMSASGLMVTTDGGQTWTTGYNPQTGEMILQALSTITLRALEIYGSTITFGDVNDKYITASVYTNSSNVAQGVSFDGTGTIRLQPQEQFLVNNQTADQSHNYNQIEMNRLGSTYGSNYIALRNYDDEHDFLLANFIELEAHRYDSSLDADNNNTLITNYATATGTRYSANYISLAAYGDRNYTYLINYKPQASTYAYANRIQLSATSTSDGMFLYNNSLANNTLANSLSFNANATSNDMQIINDRVGTDTTIRANSLQLTCNNSDTTKSNGAYLSNIQWDSTSSSTFANQVSLYSSTSGNTLNLNNYNTALVLKNNILLSFTSSEVNTTITNNNPSAGRTANVFTLKSTSSRTDVDLRNYKATANYEANIVQMYDSGSVATIDVSNYMYSDTTSSHYLANSLIMRSNSNNNYASITNYTGSDNSNYANTFHVTHQSSQNYVRARNYQLGGTTIANYIGIYSGSSYGNTVEIYNYDSSNTEINSLVMKSDKTLTMYCGSDMRLYSGGAIRLSANTNSSGSSSGGNQDIHLTGYTLHIYYTDKVSFHKGSARYNLNFNSDGSVTWSS